MRLLFFLEWLVQEGTTGVLYEGSDVRTVNGLFVLPRDRGLEYASLKYRRRNSVIIIASLREYKRALLYAPTNFNTV